MTLPFGVPLPCPTFPCGALESGYVVFEFLARHLRVKLRSGDIGIPQNLAHAFYRHTVFNAKTANEWRLKWNEIGFSIPHFFATALMRLFTVSSEPMLNSRLSVLNGL